MKCNKCGKEMSFENTTGRGFDIGLCEECEWDKPADLPEAGASAERISSVVRSNATTGWISVNERLPECGKKVLATYKNEYGKDITICAMYAERYKIESTLNEDCDDEYSEELDNYFIKEGWYEVIENWPDYSTVVVHEGVVTHWMPLPDAPEV